MENLNLKIDGDQKELVILTGQARPHEYPEILSLSGTIVAPADFAEQRKPTIEALNTHVVADYTKRTITLVCNEASKYKTTVKGSLLTFPDLLDFTINAKKTYSQKALLELVKFKGPYFKTPEQHTELISKLKKFESKVEQTFESANDYKGAAATKKVVEIKTNLVLEFDLCIPVFTGGRVEKFKVDICVDCDSTGPIFWLESVDLHSIIIKATEAAFDEQLKRLSNYVIIKTW